MFQIDETTKMSDDEKYEYLLMMLEGIISSEENNLSLISNACAVMNAVLDRINWIGFYFMRNGELVIGPFQGLPACNRLKFGVGVCGAAARDRETKLVVNVHEFPSHIACDAASNSELVIPLIKNNVVYGVLDIDSPQIGRFKDIDRKYMEKAVDILNKYIDYTPFCII